MDMLLTRKLSSFGHGCTAANECACNIYIDKGSGRLDSAGRIPSDGCAPLKASRRGLRTPGPDKRECEQLKIAGLAGPAEDAVSDNYGKCA